MQLCYLLLVVFAFIHMRQGLGAGSMSSGQSQSKLPRCSEAIDRIRRLHYGMQLLIPALDACLWHNIPDV